MASHPEFSFGFLNDDEQTSRWVIVPKVLENERQRARDDDSGLHPRSRPPTVARVPACARGGRPPVPPPRPDRARPAGPTGAIATPPQPPRPVRARGAGPASTAVTPSQPPRLSRARVQSGPQPVYMAFEIVRALFDAFRRQMGPAARTVFEREARAIGVTPSTVPLSLWPQLVGQLERQLASIRARQAFITDARRLQPASNARR